MIVPTWEWPPPRRPRLSARLWRAGWLAFRAAAVLFAAVLGLTLIAAVWGVALVPVERPAPPPIVTDVTRLYAIPVARVLTPTTVDEIVAAVKTHRGPIAVGGGRYSMGGQTATEGALHIDMRRMNRVLAFDAAAKIIAVQAGATWRQIQEHIDPADLSVKIMQTYADFTVGGSLSVNVHGRYIGLGPLVLSVRAIRVVLPDGTLVTASPGENTEIFYGVIGGYGGLGVIVEATLDLADNVPVRRTDRTLPIGEYARYFADSVRDVPAVVFHNGDIYPNGYRTVHTLTYATTDDPVTVSGRLIPRDRSYRLNRMLFTVISEWPFGKSFRRLVVDPIVYRGNPVTWRNYEASYTVMELEPGSREASTYVLQEYFVPVEGFDAFVPRMREILRRHDVNVVNVSIRHARPDPGTLLAWARDEVFAFVLYYKQGTDVATRARVGTWTRELIDAVLAVGGTYYLPYQVHASREQFLRAYPGAEAYFALKRRLDPDYRFRNKLWDAYYRPAPGVATVDVDPGVHARLQTREGYARDGGQTFLTHPEWYIVYNSDEYATYLQDRLPTGFPYVASIGQFWVNYREARALTRHRYPMNWGYHVMLWVIGTSYSAELAIKGLYEHTIGRFTGWTTGGALTAEDRWAATAAADYGRFIHVRPWYEFGYADALGRLWGDTPFWGRHFLRKWERRSILTLEYAFKAAYGGLIRLATRATYGVQDDRIRMVVTGWREELGEGVLEPLEALDDVRTLVAAPRYDAFRDALLELAAASEPPSIQEIAGNDEILLTGVAPSAWTYPAPYGILVYALPLATDASRKRIAVRAPVTHVLDIIRVLTADPLVTIDHIYDY